MQKNEEYLARANRVIPQQTMTMSKAVMRRPLYSPVYAQSGLGPYIIDVDGNVFTDYMGGLGTNILGYRRIHLTEGAYSSSLSIPSYKEVELIEKLLEHYPADMGRILKTGSEACAAAVRIARVYTGRDNIATCGYHGWHDTFNDTAPGYGTPLTTKRLTQQFIYDDLVDLKRVIEVYHPACVIMEPVMLTEPSEGYLQGVRELCDKSGTVLIFDEVVTGFWWGLGGAQKMYGVVPDITVLGKAMGNGVAIAAVVGKKEIMGKDYFVSSTYAGETLAINTVLACIEQLEKEDYNARNERAKRLFEAIKGKCGIYGFPWRAAFPWEEKTYIFWQQAAKAGILFGNPFFFGFSITDKVLDKTLEVIKNIDMSVSLEGPAPTQVFNDGRTK
jgi:glutamate-1-semialdehyde 2,1-aminomutase